MKNLLPFLVILGLGLTSQTLRSQSTINIDSIQSVLDLNLAEDSIEIFLKNVHALELEIIKDESQNYEDHIDLLDSLYEIPLNKQVDSFLYRTYLCRHAVKIKNITNDYVHALDYYLLAYAYAKDKTVLDNYGWYNEKHIADNYAQLNQYDRAILFYKKCIPFLEQNSNFKNLSRLYADLGKAYRWQKDELNMYKFYDLAIVYGEKSKSYLGLQAVHLNYAKFHREQSIDSFNDQSFFKHLNSSKIYLEKMKNQPTYLGMKKEIFMEEFEYLHKIGNLNTAEEKLKECLAISEQVYTTKRSRERAKTKIKVVNYYLDQNQLETANKYLKSAFNDLLPDYTFKEIPNKNILVKENTFADLLSYKSDYYRLKYNNSKNSSYLDSALHSIDLALASKISLDNHLVTKTTKLASIEINKKLIDKSLNICYLKYQVSDNTRLQEKIRNYFNQSKSVILKQESNNSQLNKEMIEMDQITLDSINENLIQLYGSNNSNINEVEIFENIQQREEIYNKYNSEKYHYKSLDQSYIEYVATDDNYFAYTNIQNDYFIKIGKRTTIDSMILNVIEKIESKSDLLSSKDLIELSQRLIPFPLEQNTELIIIPDGTLSYLPFDILVKNGKYLIHNHQISIEPHHKKLIHQNDWTKNNSVYCLAPSYEYDFKEKSKEQVASRSAVTPLPFVELEIISLEKTFGSQLKIAREFNLNELIENSTSSNIFHYSGHARATKDSCYLILDNKKAQFDYNQISSLKNNFELVVLSACETGLGQFDYGEGLRSLSSAFLNAGSKSILYSLWKVNDQSTGHLISGFYDKLNEGYNNSAALHKAKLHFIENASPDFRHPYYWAGFTLVGNEEIMKSMKLSTKLLIGSALIFLLLILKKSK